MAHFALLFLLLAAAGAASAQDKPADILEPLRQTANKTASDWAALAKGLDTKIAKLLPCDPKLHAAIEEVSHASELRLAALSTYLKAAAEKAANDSEGAKKVLAAQAALSGGWNTEHAEADQQHTAVEAEIVDLKESMRKRGTLAGSEQTLIEISNMVKQRAVKSDEHSGRKDYLNTLLGDMVVVYQDRQTTLQNEAALVDLETSKWTTYYVARLSRATTECSIINPVSARRSRGAQ